MSYAGTYGFDETCSHGDYWRSCGAGCSLVGPRATSQQIAEALARQRERQEREQAEREAKRAERHSYVVTTDGFGKELNRYELLSDDADKFRPEGLGRKDDLNDRH